MEQPIYTEEQVKAMQNVDIRTVDPAGLRDIRDVKVNTDLPKRERILDFIRQIGNPYCYRHGKYVVKVSFTDTDVTLEDRCSSSHQRKYCPPHRAWLFMPLSVTLMYSSVFFTTTTTWPLLLLS